MKLFNFLISQKTTGNSSHGNNKPNLKKKELRFAINLRDRWQGGIIARKSVESVDKVSIDVVGVEVTKKEPRNRRISAEKLL